MVSLQANILKHFGHFTVWNIRFYFNDRGEDFYATGNTLGLNKPKDSEDAVDRLVADVEKQYVIYLF